MSDELFQVRLDKKNKLEAMGVDPYGARFEKDRKILDIVNDFKENTKVKTAGRIMSMRRHGKTVFCDLKDDTSKIQLYFRTPDLNELQSGVFDLLDIGDILGVSGDLFKTHAGEVTIFVKDFQILSKSLRPLPEKWHGLKDIEIRCRQRYLDLITSDTSRDIFKTRSKIISKVRGFLDERGFLEVETPMMQSIVGGATARPFITHHNALDIDLYLRIAPELYLKRLLVGGFEKVYELNRNFRNEGISYKHNPEFTMMEVYASFWNYEDMINLVEEMVCKILNDLMGTLSFEIEGQMLNFERPWKRIYLVDELKKLTGIDFLNVRDEDAKRVGKSIGLDESKALTKADLFNNAFEKYIECKIVQPTFVIGHPVFMCPLAKCSKENPNITERFELIIRGQELANAYSELNDPIQQYERFLQQGKLKAGEENQWEMDEAFVRALEYAMPPAAGLGIGIDRLVMLLTKQHSIRDVILFPQLKPEDGRDSSGADTPSE